MNKIVFLNIPAYGHVNPTLPVVQELVRRGDTVIYYNAEEFRAPIERTEAVFRPYPATDLTGSEISLALQDGKLANVSKLLLHTAEALLPFVLEELRREQPDLVVYDATVIWGRYAAANLNLRAAASITTFILDLKSGRFNAADIFGMLRQTLPSVPAILASRVRLSRRYGKALPTNRTLFPVLGGLNLVFTARELQPETDLIDDSFRFVGPSINPQTRSEDFPFALLDEGRVIYISLGTVHSSTDFYRECFAAFASFPAQFVLAVGKNTPIDALGEIPANFIVRPSVPQLELLERADAFITHGGINSVQEGLYYGVPLIVIPQQVEQLFNARIVGAHGAGIVIEAQIAHRPVTAADLRGALDALLKQPGYREAAQALQKILRAGGGYQQAADELQRYATAGGLALV
jgi:MGT family glycosyltransferase